MGVFGCKKMRLRTIRSKNGHHFLPPTISKIGELDTCFIRISQPGEFWANSKNSEFLAHLWPISPKIPKSKPYAALGQFFR